MESAEVVTMISRKIGVVQIVLAIFCCQSRLQLFSCYWPKDGDYGGHCHYELGGPNCIESLGD